MSWNPTHVTIKVPLMRKTTGNHLKKSVSLERTQSPVSGFCNARNRVCSAVMLGKGHGGQYKANIMEERRK